MYRIVFFKIPFMRGGYRVPVCPVIHAPITYMGAWKVAEVVTDLAFAETQREIIVDGATAVAADDGKANYVYIAQTTNNAVGVYTDDVRGAYYWMDDLQFVGVQDGSDTPAAVVTISPDVWLTDFCSGYTSVHGRLAQSSLLLADEPRTPLVAPVYDVSGLSQYYILSVTPTFLVVGVFALANGAIYALAFRNTTASGLDDLIQKIGATAQFEKWTGGSDRVFGSAASCIKVYVLPNDFATTTSGESLIATNLAGTVYRVRTSETAEDYTQGYGFVESFAPTTPVGLRRVLNVTAPTGDTAFNSLNTKAWLATPARCVSLDATRGIKYKTGAAPTLAAFFIAASTTGDDNVQVYLQVGDEITDVSNDFIADFAVNDKAVQQAQQKQLVALQTITSVIGAAGGVAGGIASGNYFGAVQAIAGGAETFASLGAAKRTPAQIRGNGGAVAFVKMTGQILWLLSCETIVNSTRIAETEAEYGWQYDNAPYYDNVLEYDRYYRFAEVTIEGDMTGGQCAKQEVATALTTGVRLVDISKL